MDKVLIKEKIECHVVMSHAHFPSLAFGPIVDRVANGMHANRMVAKKEATKVDCLDSM